MVSRNLTAISMIAALSYSYGNDFADIVESKPTQRGTGLHPNKVKVKRKKTRKKLRYKK